MTYLTDYRVLAASLCGLDDQIQASAQRGDDQAMYAFLAVRRQVLEQQADLLASARCRLHAAVDRYPRPSVVSDIRMPFLLRQAVNAQVWRDVAEEDFRVHLLTWLDAEDPQLEDPQEAEAFLIPISTEGGDADITTTDTKEPLTHDF